MSLQFSDTSARQGIIQYCEDITLLGATGISGTTARLQEFTRYANLELSEVWHTIFTAGGTWEYDDANHTDLPEVTTTLTTGIDEYALESDQLAIERVEAQGSDGVWYRLSQVNTPAVLRAIDEYQDTPSIPREYSLSSNKIQLFPAPNYTQSASLKVYFTRGSVSFATSDTTATPGFASEYHEIIPLGASLRWLRVHKPDDSTTQRIENERAKMIERIREFYQKRNRDYTPRLRRAKRSYK